ncbi:MAG: LegC family aminotransferase [Candidatus Omnitrophota bacterium]
MIQKNKTIPLSVPSICGNEWTYVKECLDTGWVSSVGSYVDRFESVLAEYVGSKYAVAIVNGTAALHLSLLACGIGPEDEVIVPGLTFIAPVNAVRYCGAFPVFMDCDRETLCLDVNKTRDFIRTECIKRQDGYAYNKKTKKRIKAIIPVHVFGHPTDMDPLLDIAEEYNINVIEDATESLGSEYKGRKTGSFGEIGCFSFNGNKIITTGGGGMVVTDKKELSDRIRHLSTQAKKNSFEYDHDLIGYNYRLNNVQAAIGIAQMENIEKFIEIKRKNSSLYRSLFSNMDDINFAGERPEVKSNFWFYTLRVPAQDKYSLMQYLILKGIEVRPLWKLIHTLPMYKKSAETYLIEEAVNAYDTCINLPCSVSLKTEEVEVVTTHIRSYFESR